MYTHQEDLPEDQTNISQPAIQTSTTGQDWSSDTPDFGRISHSSQSGRFSLRHKTFQKAAICLVLAAVFICLVLFLPSQAWALIGIIFGICILIIALLRVILALLRRRAKQQQSTSLSTPDDVLGFFYQEHSYSSSQSEQPNFSPHVISAHQDEKIAPSGDLQEYSRHSQTPHTPSSSHNDMYVSSPAKYPSSQVSMFDGLTTQHEK